MGTVKLPPLPEAQRLSYRGDVGYTADQLRADRLAVTAAVIEACAAKFSELMEDDPWSHYSVHCDAIRAIKLEEVAETAYYDLRRTLEKHG